MSVKLSPKYQVVIPQAVREALGLKVGQEIDVIAKGKIAYLVPVKTLAEVQAEMGKGPAGELQKGLREKKDQ